MNKKIKAWIEAWVYGIILVSIGFLISEFTGLQKFNVIQGKTISKILHDFDIGTLFFILLSGFGVGWFVFYKRDNSKKL